MTQRYSVKYGKKLIGKTDLEDALKRLDKLTHEEARMATAEVLKMTHVIDEGVTGVKEQVASVVDQLKRSSHPNILLLFCCLDLRYLVGDQDVPRWLSPPDPSTNHALVWKARHIGTASWFFETNALAEWKARGSLLWVHGKRKYLQPQRMFCVINLLILKRVREKAHFCMSRPYGFVEGYS